MRSAHLASVFDFLGGMVHVEPPHASTLMLSTLGECSFITLLWGPEQKPEHLESEFRQAVWSGAASVGSWVYPPGHRGSRRVQMREGSY
jgi:hypothetical protein